MGRMVTCLQVEAYNTRLVLQDLLAIDSYILPEPIHRLLQPHLKPPACLYLCWNRAKPRCDGLARRPERTGSNLQFPHGFLLPILDEAGSDLHHVLSGEIPFQRLGERRCRIEYHVRTPTRVVKEDAVDEVDVPRADGEEGQGESVVHPPFSIIALAELEFRAVNDAGVAVARPCDGKVV